MSQTDNETVCINIWPEFHNNHIRGAIATSWPPAPAARRLLASSGANILVSWSRNPDRYDAIICLNGEILLSVKSSTNWLWSPPYCMKKWLLLGSKLAELWIFSHLLGRPLIGPGPPIVPGVKHDTSFHNAELSLVSVGGSHTSTSQQYNHTALALSTSLGKMHF